MFPGEYGRKKYKNNDVIRFTSSSEVTKSDDFFQVAQESVNSGLTLHFENLVFFFKKFHTSFYCKNVLITEFKRL